MKSLAIAALSLAVSACAMPRYQTSLVAFSKPQVDREQAMAICEPEARLAGARASAAASTANAPPPSPSTYQCQSTGYGTSSCTAQPGYVSPYASLAQGYAAGDAERAARDATLQGCLARLGWKIERRCVENCR